MSKIIINGKSNLSLKAYSNGEEVNSIRVGDATYSRMVTGTQPAPPTPSTRKYLCLTATGIPNNLKLEIAVNTSGDQPYDPVLEYSTNQRDWTRIPITSTDRIRISLPKNVRACYLRSENPLSGVVNGVRVTLHPYLSAAFRISGHVASIIDYRQMDTLTAIPDYGLYGVFSGGSTLTGASSLSFEGITTVGTRACQSMFAQNSNLTSAPALPATNLGTYCYYTMFNNCYSLASMPALPATNVPQSAYYGMFENCRSLTSADVHYATNVTTASCGRMFYGCSSLTTVYTPSINGWYTGWFTDWLVSPGNNGTMYLGDVKTIPPLNNVSGCPSGWTLVYQPEPVTFSAIGIGNVEFSYQIGTGQVNTVAAGTSVVENIDHGQTYTMTTIGSNYHLFESYGPYGEGIDHGPGPVTQSWTRYDDLIWTSRYVDSKTITITSDGSTYNYNMCCVHQDGGLSQGMTVLQMSNGDTLDIFTDSSQNFCDIQLNGVSYGSNATFAYSDLEHGDTISVSVVPSKNVFVNSNMTYYNYDLTSDINPQHGSSQFGMSFQLFDGDTLYINAMQNNIIYNGTNYGNSYLFSYTDINEGDMIEITETLKTITIEGNGNNYNYNVCCDHQQNGMSDSTTFLQIGANDSVQVNTFDMDCVIMYNGINYGQNLNLMPFEITDGDIIEIQRM